MEQVVQRFREVEIDLRWFVDLLVRRKKAFFSVFFAVLVSGLYFASRFLPQVYVVTMNILPALSGGSLAERGYPEVLQDVRSLVSHSVFETDVINKLNLNPDTADWDLEEPILHRHNLSILSFVRQVESKEQHGKILKAFFGKVSKEYSVPEPQSMGTGGKIKITLDEDARFALGLDPVSSELRKAPLTEGRLIVEIDLPKDPWNRGYVHRRNLQGADDFKISMDHSRIVINKLNMNEPIFSNLTISKKPEILCFLEKPDRNKILLSLVILGFSLGVLGAFLSESWAILLRRI